MWFEIHSSLEGVFKLHLSLKYMSIYMLCDRSLRCFVARHFRYGRVSSRLIRVFKLHMSLEGVFKLHLSLEGVSKLYLGMGGFSNLV